ncbi:MAG: hypothetical protein KAT16_06445, partial [Candidatus Heimdallarchaeota archaeon]|nr:hypothetical protein [Candidatus Heimdallarchaeota archaeon]
MSKSSNRISPIFELRTPDILSPQKALIRWQQQNFPEQSADEFTILTTDKLEVFRHPSQDPLLP